MDIRSYEARDEVEVIALWHRCGLVFPANDPAKDIARKLLVRPDLFLVGLIDGRVVATAMAGYEGHRGWINYLAVHPDHQRKGLGREILGHAEHLLIREGCPKINLQVRSSNQTVIAFYHRVGYVTDEVTSLGKRLQHDGRAGPLPDEEAKQ